MREVPEAQTAHRNGMVLPDFVTDWMRLTPAGRDPPLFSPAFQLFIRTVLAAHRGNGSS